MITYLTSKIGGFYKTDGMRIPAQLNADNGLLDSLQKHWKVGSKVLIISGDEYDIEKNDSIRNVFSAAFPMSGLVIQPNAYL